VGLCLGALGADPFGKLVERPGWKVETFFVPRDYLVKVDSKKPEAEPQWEEGLTPQAPIAGLNRIFDAKGWLKSGGVSFPEGAVAEYDAIDQRLTVYNSATELELVRVLFTEISPPVPVNLN
jgi:hypothetical protein